MPFKRDVEEELSKVSGVLVSRPDHSMSEMVSICSSMPISCMKGPSLFCRYVESNQLSLADGASLLMWVLPLRGFLRKIKAESHVTYQDLRDAYKRVQCHSILIHRLNHILHECMIEVYDWLEHESRLKMAAKKWYRRAEGRWDSYFRPRMRQIDETAWCTLQDHFVIAYDMVSPHKEKVYESLRNYMIRLGWRDVELKARCCLALLMGKVVGTTSSDFFEEARKVTHVEWTKCFSEADLQPMVRDFAMMCDALGMKVEKGSGGYYEMAGFVPESNQRFLWAWNEFMSVLSDNGLMDESALRAFELNPSVKEEYNRALEEERREEFDKGVQRLGLKYNISKKGHDN